MRPLAALLAALLALPAGAQDAAPLRPLARSEAVLRCSPDGRACIGSRSYAADVCRTIEQAAGAEGIDAGFLARLLWRESLFDAGAVSRKGAQGIAQFMPATAARRGLSDPFNPAEAILASAAYLADLERMFGNPGLAAAAYNAGEARAEDFAAGRRGLPGETRAYVAAITGHAAEAWRAGPPPEAPMALDPALPFREACLARAEGRGRLPEPAPALEPWGVILAAQASRAQAEAMAARTVARHGGLLGGERIDHVRARVPGLAQRRHVAQVGRATRGEAEALCAALRAEGGACVVLRN
jgi:hypothetical protein